MKVHLANFVRVALIAEHRRVSSWVSQPSSYCDTGLHGLKSASSRRKNCPGQDSNPDHLVRSEA
jgi:hypothetical protein